MKIKSFFKSTVVRIVAMIIVLVLPINIITLVLSGRVLKNNQEQTAIEIQDTLKISNNSLETILNRASRKLLYTSLSHSEFIELANKPLDNSTQGRLLTFVRKQMSDIKLDYDWIDLMYARFPMNDLTMLEGHPGFDLQSCRELIIEESDKVQQSTQGKQRSWTWRLDEVSGNSVLFGFRHWNGTDVGCIINLERLLRKMGLNENLSGRTVFFMNSDGTAYSDAGVALLDNLDTTLQELEKDSRYGVFYSPLSDYDLCLVEVVKWNTESRNLPSYIIFMQVLSILLSVLVLPILLISVRRWIGRPLNALTKAINQVEQGNLEHHIPVGENNQGKEFGQINQNFNHMLDQIEDLKIDMYEKELEQKNIRMKYLSQQIQPHFILNAMNILYSYEPEEYELSQKMIQCISKYFRHIVKANDAFVELDQEMNHIQNYFEIQKARFPELFFAIVEYEESLKRALIPPLLLQNFAENAIKHSLKIGKNIAIYVVGEKIIEDGIPKMRIRIADTGEGISDEILEQIQAFRQTGQRQPGLGVGIVNAIDRLKYLYADKSTIKIERDPHYHGTNVEIILPVVYAEEGRIYDETFFDR
ncbi:MAG: histidine kinase [Agathobacter sp.]|nr:histidine kinase [Agathobacter sp.]